MIIKKCSCELSVHKAPVERYEISSGAIKKLPEILGRFKKIYLVSDINTYRAAGRAVEDILKQVGIYSHTHILSADVVLPNAETVGEIFVNLYDIGSKPNIFEYADMPDFILAVGSGTINDSCRMVSYRTGIPYGIFATAPSMDGYLSAGSPYLHDGTKSTVQGTTPRYFIADTDIVKEAPYDMLLAGIGDMFGKYTGLLDWELARDYAGEYFCDEIAADVLDATNKCLTNGYKLKVRDGEAIEKIMEGFTVTGLGMAFTGSSRPASGAEHIVAHAWELFDIEAKSKPKLHGLEVCQATRLIAIMYALVYKNSDDAHFKALVEKYIPYFAEVEKFCREMSVPLVTTDRALMISGFRRALLMRDRYTILFYLRDRGILDKYIEMTVDEFLKIIQK